MQQKCLQDVAAACSMLPLAGVVPELSEATSQPGLAIDTRIGHKVCATNDLMGTKALCFSNFEHVKALSI